MARTLALVALSYLFGAIPIAYFAGRWFGGVDLRRVGTGVVGASNLGNTRAGRWTAPVGLAQIAQGALPPLVLRREPASLRVVAGLAAIAGQDWNPWLGLRGGRGMAHSIGFLLVLSPASLVVFAVLGVIGRLAGQVPLSMMLGLVVSPLFALWGGRPRAVVLGCGGVALMAAARRLQGSDGLPRSRSVALWRLLFDRDVVDRAEWQSRIQAGEGWKT
jgi:glycerol-3-phosphate acyltransferase PlsY